MHILHCMLTGFNNSYSLCLFSGVSKIIQVVLIFQTTTIVIATKCHSYLISLQFHFIYAIISQDASTHDAAICHELPSSHSHPPSKGPYILLLKYVSNLILESYCKVLFPRATWQPQ